jgi:hypothetical protein
MDDLWQNERRLWQAGVAAYEELMGPECMMAFAPMGIMARSEIIDCMHDAPRWSSIDMTDVTQTGPAGNVSIIGYRVLATRPGNEPYEAVCTSTYVAVDGRWKLAQHQQSVVQQA